MSIGISNISGIQEGNLEFTVKRLKANDYQEHSADKHLRILYVLTFWFVLLLIASCINHLFNHEDYEHLNELEFLFIPIRPMLKSSLEKFPDLQVKW